MRDFIIVQGDILEQKVDAIVCPAHASGYMGYGAAKAIVAAGGKEIESEAVAQAPLIIGDAIATSAGKLSFKNVIHTATIDVADEALLKGNISKATIGAVLLADDMGLRSIAIPGVGTGLAGVHVIDSAEAMLLPLLEFVPHHLEKIIFVDLNPEMVDAWQRVVAKRVK